MILYLRITLAEIPGNPTIYPVKKSLGVELFSSLIDAGVGKSLEDLFNEVDLRCKSGTNRLGPLGSPLWIMSYSVLE